MGLFKSALPARKIAVTKLAGEGHNFSSAARILGVSTPALWEFTKRHNMQAERRAFKEAAGGSSGKAGVALEEARRRLSEVAKQEAEESNGSMARTRAAYHLDIPYPTLTKWLQANAPWGAADALVDFGDSDIAVQQ